MSELTLNSEVENTSNAEQGTNIDGKKEIKPQDETLQCRACLQKFGSVVGMIDLFQAWIHPWDGMGHSVAEDLAKLANIEISTTDAFSKHICQLCYQKLLDACSFSSNVHSNDQVLRRNINENAEVWPKPIIVDNTILNNVMEVEIKQEPLSDNEADGVSDYMGSEDVNMQPDFTNLDIKVEPEEITQPHPIKITVNGTITNDQFAQNSIMTNGDILCDARIEVTVKQEPQSDDEDNEIVPDLPLECMLCAKAFNSVTGLKAHVIAQHSYKTVKRKTDSIVLKENGDVNKYVCALCRRKFTTSTDLMVHETCHNKHSCYGCNEKFDTFALLTSHREKCKAVLSKIIKKPKTLEDVKRVNNNKKKRQQRYREQNREKLKQREAERRITIKRLQSIARLPTSSNINIIELNNDKIIDANSQSLPGLKRTQASSIQRNEQIKEKTALQKKRECQQRYREQNREKLKQREAERRQRLQNSEIITESSRPQVEVPQLAEIKIEPQEMSSDNSQFADDSSDASNVKVHLKIKSLSGNQEVSENNDIEMNLKAFDAFSKDDVIQ